MSNAPFGFDAPEHSPGFLLWQTTMNWQRLIKKGLEPYNVSHAQFVIMASLMWFQGLKQDVTQVKIIQMSKLDKMTVSASLKKLTTMDLVIRTEHEVDTRAKKVCLSTKGTTLMTTLIPIVEGIDEKFFSRLSPANESKLITTLSCLSDEEKD